jgi:hypothetical protein
VQVDPAKPKLKLPGTKRLNLKCDGPVSNFALTLNLHHYIKESLPAMISLIAVGRQGLTLIQFSAQPEPFLTQNIIYSPHNIP